MTKLMIALIRIYQKYVSPGLPRRCRFYPTCSQYAVEAFSKYGFIKGGALSAYRLLRCNPFCKGGYDPLL